MQSKRWLIIGYGNTLRGDDGVGQQVAAAVTAWAQPQIQALAVHQLTPDLAAAIAEVTQVVFVDAALNTGTPPTIALAPLQLNGTETFTTHIASPHALLALAQRLYGATPIAYLLTIPGVDFELGEGLSAIATTGKAQALQQLRDLCLDDFHKGSRQLSAAPADPASLKHVGLHAVAPNRRAAAPGRGHSHA